MSRISGWAALSGVVAVATAVVASELAASALSPSVSPVSAVGSVVIDGLPPGVKDWAIEAFGTADKLVFLIGMSLIIALVAAGSGVLEYRRRYAGAAVVVLFGVGGLFAVGSRPQAETMAFVAPAAALLLGVLILSFLIGRLTGWAAPGASRQETAGVSRVARRRFLWSVGGGTVVAGAAGLLAANVRSSQSVVTQARSRIVLPRPQSTAAPTPETTPEAPEGTTVPAGADLGVEGVEPLITPNDDYYRIDTALVVPIVDPATWKLRVTGMVDREMEISFEELLAKPLIERYITLACVSNEVGGSLIGNARWLGWPVREVLELAGVTAGADMVLSRSVDGFTAGTPPEAMTDQRDALIAVGVNGEALPVEHGFPVRLVVPGLYGFVSATKWLSELKVTRFGDDLAYWSTRGWSERGPVKTSSRIDVPSNNAQIPAGTVTVAGYAWAQHRGIETVELKVDGGPWQKTRLAAAISRDTWRQFSAKVDLEPGTHTVQVRAADSSGEFQVDKFTAVAPDGATGLHTVTFNVE